jgi:type II secretory pathway pseudopilin PulG
MKSGNCGFTLLSLLIVVSVLGAGLAAFGRLASHVAQREKEAELLFRGEQIREAIGSYYRKERRYPQSLAELLEDKRYPMPQRHLRKLYEDPFTGAADWGLVTAPAGGIMGVHSQSQEAPVKSGNFPLARQQPFEGAARYADWQFVHTSPSGPAAAR